MFPWDSLWKVLHKSHDLCLHIPFNIPRNCSDTEKTVYNNGESVMNNGGKSGYSIYTLPNKQEEKKEYANTIQ